MLPAGLGIVCASPKALAQREQAKLPARLLRPRRHDQGQRDRLLPLHAVAARCSTACASRSPCCSRRGSRTCSPATTGWPRARARAVKAWGLELCAKAPQVVLRHGQRDHGAGRRQRRRGDRRRLPALQPRAGRRASRGWPGKLFRIGHLGDLNELHAARRASPAPRWRCATSASRSRRAAASARPRNTGAAPPHRCQARAAAARARRAAPRPPRQGEGHRRRRPMSHTRYEPARPRLQRSELAVPGSKPAMFAKALDSEADYVFLDLEDAVAPADKEQARQNVIAGCSSTTGAVAARRSASASTASTPTTCTATWWTWWSRPATGSTPS